MPNSRLEALEEHATFLLEAQDIQDGQVIVLRGPSEHTQYVANVVEHFCDDMGLEDIRLLILPSGTSLTLLSDEQLTHMGLERIPDDELPD